MASLPWLLAPAGWSAATLSLGYVLSVQLRAPDAGWFVNWALWVATLLSGWRTLVVYEDVPAGEPGAPQQAAGWMMCGFSLLMLGWAAVAGIDAATAQPWPETKALVVEAETRSGEPWLAFTHETGGRQYMSAPFPAGRTGMWRAGSRYPVRYNPQRPSQIDVAVVPPGRRASRLLILAAALGALLLVRGWQQVRTAPALTSRRTAANPPA